MNTIDLVIGIVLLIAFFMGFGKGLIRSLASLVGLVLGVYCAIYFSDYVRFYVERWSNWSEDWKYWASFLITFLIIMLLFSIIGSLLTRVANFALMGPVNKIFGGIFNALKYAFLISAIFMFVNASNEYRILSPEQLESSRLYEPIASIAPAILPAIMREVDEMDLEFPKINSPFEQKKDSIQ